MVDLNQVPANPYATSNTDSAPAFHLSMCIRRWAPVADHRPYPCWSVIQSVANAAESNYNSGSVEVSRHTASRSLRCQLYLHARTSRCWRRYPNAFAVAGAASSRTASSRPRLWQRHLRSSAPVSCYVSLRPAFGKASAGSAQAALSTALLAAGNLPGVTILQSGPFLTPYQQSVDPANTNILTTVGQARPDQLSGVLVYAPQRTTCAVA